MLDPLIDIIQVPHMWAVCGVAVLAGFSRGLAGFGVALIMLPLGAAVLGPHVIIPVMPMIDIPTSLWLAYSVRQYFDRREIAILLPAALLGLLLGVQVLLVADAALIKTVASLAVLAFAVALASGFRISGKPSWRRSASTGLLAGVMEGAIGLPGPPLILGWLAAQVPGPKLRANVIVFFLGLTVIAIPTFATAGLITGHVARCAVILFPFYFAGVLIGKTAHGHVPETVFKRIVLGLVIAGAIAALVD